MARDSATAYTCAAADTRFAVARLAWGVGTAGCARTRVAAGSFPGDFTETGGSAAERTPGTARPTTHGVDTIAAVSPTASTTNDAASTAGSPRTWRPATTGARDRASRRTGRSDGAEGPSTAAAGAGSGTGAKGAETGAGCTASGSPDSRAMIAPYADWAIAWDITNRGRPLCRK